MEIKSIILSLEYVEFANSVDELIFDLLYSESGYYSLNSKNAISKANSFIEKFDIQIDKLKKNTSFDGIDNIIQEKRQNFVEKIQNHYKKQLLVWVDEVYQNFINCLLLSISFNKQNKEYLKLIFNRGLSGISWYSKIKNLDNSSLKCLFDKYKEDFNRALSIKDSDYLKNNVVVKTKPEVFLNIRKLFLNDLNSFLKTDFDQFQKDLTKKDILFFNRIKNQSHNSNITSILDEFKLIDSAIQILNLKNNEKIYEFITQVHNDFNNLILLNKTVSENEKVIAIKRRMRIFQDDEKRNSNYFKNLINS